MRYPPWTRPRASPSTSDAKFFHLEPTLTRRLARSSRRLTRAALTRAMRTSRVLVLLIASLAAPCADAWSYSWEARALFDKHASTPIHDDEVGASSAEGLYYTDKLMMSGAAHTAIDDEVKMPGVEGSFTDKTKVSSAATSFTDKLKKMWSAARARASARARARQERGRGGGTAMDGQLKVSGTVGSFTDKTKVSGTAVGSFTDTMKMSGLTIIVLLATAAIIMRNFFGATLLLSSDDKMIPGAASSIDGKRISGATGSFKNTPLSSTMMGSVDKMKLTALAVVFCLRGASAASRADCTNSAVNNATIFQPSSRGSSNTSQWSQPLSAS